MSLNDKDISPSAGNDLSTYFEGMRFIRLIDYVREFLSILSKVKPIERE
jgi:hypothetical protein